MPLRTLLAFFFLTIITAAAGQSGSVMTLKKVIIDPGHGGKDPGAVSVDGKVKEKNITLAVSLKLGNLIKRNFPGTEVIYTRDTDKFIPLDRRSQIANQNKGDLFISIHVNSVENRSVTGSETFVMGVDKTSSNLEVTMLENNVILLEGEDYITRYGGYDPKNPESYIIFSLLQNAHMEQSLELASLIQTQFSNGPIKVNRGIKQGPLLVLWKTSMPAVLVELGFISNQSDLKILNNSEHQDKLATFIFNAFKEYKQSYENGSRIVASRQEMPKQDSSIQEAVKKEIPKQRDSAHFYAIQIMALGKSLPLDSPLFKGKKGIKEIKIENLYKYTLGEYATVSQAKEALRAISQDFPGAFIITIKNGTIVPFIRE